MDSMVSFSTVSPLLSSTTVSEARLPVDSTSEEGVDSRMVFSAELSDSSSAPRDVAGALRPSWPSTRSAGAS